MLDPCERVKTSEFELEDVQQDVDLRYVRSKIIEYLLAVDLLEWG